MPTQKHLTPKPDEVPAIDYGDYAADAGAGLEGGRAEELLLPFIYVLQPLSPQLDKTGAGYVPEADEGMFFNTLTGLVYDGATGLEGVAVNREYLYTEWNPREKGGGFKGTRSPDDDLVRRLKREQGAFQALRTPDGTDLVEQFNLAMILGPAPLSLETCFQGLIPFKSTSIGVYKAFYSRATSFRYKTPKGMITPPIWAHRWRVTTAAMKNDSGRWYNPKFELVSGPEPARSLLPASDPLYGEAKRLNEMFRAGQVRTDYEAGREPGDDVDDIPPL
jgi:hypothetical protein